MARKLFFGEYLIEHGLVSEEDVLEALSVQEKKTPPLETVAIKLAFLSMKQIFKIFTLQAGTEGSFSDIALKNNFLNDTQVNQIIEKRKSLKPPIGQILIDTGKISAEIMEAEAKKFDAIVAQYNAIRKVLMAMPVFSKIGKSAGNYLAYLPDHLHFKSGEKVIAEGDDADCFFCVISGSLKVTANNPEGGREVYITTIERNDTFGEASIFAHEKRTANITAIDDVQLYQFHKDDFIEFLKKFPASSQPILIFILQRLLYKLNCTNKELAFERRKFIGQDEVNTLMDELFE